ncbi:hypothetical protein QWY77_06550 [Thalassotalea ponticola]|uniref:carboxylate--amine ligase n=1 Tax=Thalassotalea ponticola TaxID=1523392 RepID=UPI0025B60101|nr:hypothetical protein [Thalassotalea ponticola]MDN3652422.1 hypothetical protein [Thalassotalea ponticola]
MVEQTLTTRALILAVGPNGLGALRSLHKAGVSCDALVADKEDVSVYSRIPRRVKSFTQGNQAELLKLLLSWPEQGLVLIPTSDWYVSFIEQYQQQLSTKFHFVLSGNKQSLEFIDKRAEINRVSSFVNVPVSVTELPNTAQLLLQLCQLPIIIKPRSHAHNALKKKNIIIDTKAQLQRFYQLFYPHLDSVIAQQVISGDDDHQWVCNCVFNEQHQLVSHFTFQRLQLSPPHYGVTCYAVSKSNDAVVEQVRSLGLGCQLVGPVMVEFKRDADDGLYKYIELNPRLGMCNYFDTQCGVNNVLATYLIALGQRVPTTKQQDNCYFLGVYEDLYSRYRDQQSIADVVNHYRQMLSKKRYYFYFCWQDPWPAVVLGYGQLKRSISAITHHVARRFSVRF